MGRYLNPGKQRFQMAASSEIFVDKTEMISYLNTLINTSQRFVSVSRPRRFGKTMAADMICAYYDREADSRSRFEETKLAGCEPVKVRDGELPWDAYLGQFDVIRVVMTEFIKERFTVSESLERMSSRILKELSRAYPEVEYDPEDFVYSMDEFYRYTETPFVIVIDEWDSVFRERQGDKKGQREYLDFLRDWMKDQEFIALAYMTGILPIKKYGKHSALNMFSEYSMTAPLQMAEYTGFTEDEVKELCREFRMNFSDVKDWYDGYLLRDTLSVDERLVRNRGGYTGHSFSIYSPLSVVNAMRNGNLGNYWNKTETYEALAEYIRMDYDGLQDTVALLMDGGRVQVDLSTYENDMTTFHSRDDVLALLIHLGYLGYDSETSEVFIPNKEILAEFRTSTKSDEWKPVFNSFRKSQRLLEATWAGDADLVAEILEDTHNKASNKTYNDESALSYSIRMAYYAAQKYYTLLPELDTGKGYADLVYLPLPKYPEKPVLLIELKYDQNADTALDQIKRQRYPDRLEAYKGNILLVGINYDKDVSNDRPEFKQHSCVIERA